MNTQALLLYNNDDKNVIITYSPRTDTMNVLLKWLDKNNISLTPFLPDKQGIWCVDEKVAYRVYQIVQNGEELVTNLAYSLQWIEQPIA